MGAMASHITSLMIVYSTVYSGEDQSSNDLLGKSPDGGVMRYCDFIIGAIASQITSLTIVYSTVYSGADQRKHQSSTSLAFVLGIHRWPVNSPHKWLVTRKMFPFDDVIMWAIVASCLNVVTAMWQLFIPHPLLMRCFGLAARCSILNVSLHATKVVTLVVVGY